MSIKEITKTTTLYDFDKIYPTETSDADMLKCLHQATKCGNGPLIQHIAVTRGKAHFITEKTVKPALLAVSAIVNIQFTSLLALYNLGLYLDPSATYGESNETLFEKTVSQLEKSPVTFPKGILLAMLLIAPAPQVTTTSRQLPAVVSDTLRIAFRHL